MSGVSIKVLLAQVESKVRPMINDMIYPIIQNFLDSSKEFQSQIDQKLKDVSDKIDSSMVEWNQLNDLKISALDEQITSEYQNLIDLKFRENQIEFHSQLTSIKQDLDFKMDRIEQNFEINNKKFDMQIKNMYDDFKNKIDEETKRRVREKRELNAEFSQIKDKFEK